MRANRTSGSMRRGEKRVMVHSANGHRTRKGGNSGAPPDLSDLVLFDPDKTVTFTPQILHSAIDYCSYDGLTVTGYPVVALSRGKVIVEEGRFVGPAGPGPLHRTGSVLRRH
jgi:dihydroorotase-like cyclic amidohydrolase